MPGSFSISHIPQVKGDFYEMESEVGQIMMRAGLPGANNYGSMDAGWFKPIYHERANLELLLHRFADADRESKARARKSIRAIENKTYWDTGKSYVL